MALANHDAVIAAPAISGGEHGLVAVILVVALAALGFSYWLVQDVLKADQGTPKMQEISRAVQAGSDELPPWEHPWQLIKDGFKFLVIILIWTVPAVLLSIPSTVVSDQSAAGELAGFLSAAGSVWVLLVTLLEPAVISQYMDRGFLRALNPVAVIRRARALPVGRRCHVTLPVLASILPIWPCVNSAIQRLFCESEMTW